MNREELEANMIKEITASETANNISKACADIAEEYAKELEGSKWVSVEERLPYSGECVLLYSKTSGVVEGAYLSDLGRFEQWRWSCECKNCNPKAAN